MTTQQPQNQPMTKFHSVFYQMVVYIYNIILHEKYLKKRPKKIFFEKEYLDVFIPYLLFRNNFGLISQKYLKLVATFIKRREANLRFKFSKSYSASQLLVATLVTV